MRKIFLFFVLWSLSICAHGQELIIFDPDFQQTQAGAITYTFDLYPYSSSAQIQPQDLVLTHTQLLHMIVFDASLNEFNHVHPAYQGQKWTANLHLPANGDYFVWLQGKTKDGQEFSIKQHMQVTGGLKARIIQPLGGHNVGVDGATQVELQPALLKAGAMAMIDFKISRTDGTDPLLEPYLGAFAHVIVTDFQSDELIHVHPMAGSDPFTGMLHTTFPKAGEYRIWIQFYDHKELKTVPLSVLVQ